MSNGTAPGWGAPSTWFISAGGLLEGAAVGTFLGSVGATKVQLAVVSFGGLLIAFGGVLAQHGH